MRQFISFYLGNNHYAIDILLSREIGRLHDISPVPEAQSYLLGIMNLRGQILTVVDPCSFLEQHTQCDIQDRVLIILKTKAELNRLNRLSHTAFETGLSIKDPLALLVDRMGETLNVEEEHILPPLPNVTGGKREFISGLIQQNNRFIIVLALEQLVKRL